MKKQETVNKIKNNDEFSSGLMESYGKWMGGDCFQNTTLPDIHEAPFDGMDPQSNGAEIEDITKKKKEVKKVTPVGAKETAPANEEYEVLEREEIELEGELYVIEKRRYFATEGSMKTARANVGASTCWKGYKAKGTDFPPFILVPFALYPFQHVEAPTLARAVFILPSVVKYLLFSIT